MEWSGEGEREGRGRAPSLLAIELRINMTLDSGEGGEGSRFSLTLFLPFFVWGGGAPARTPVSSVYSPLVQRVFKPFLQSSTVNVNHYSQNMPKIYKSPFIYLPRVRHLRYTVQCTLCILNIDFDSSLDHYESHRVGTGGIYTN